MAWDDDIDAVSILVPVDFTATPSLITSITAGGVALAEDSVAAWNSATTYNVVGTRVYHPTSHRVYENLKSDSTNINKDPTVLANQENAAGVGTYWIDVGPTNKFAMFDGLVSTPTLAASPLVITLKPGTLTGFSLLGIDADSLSVTVKDAPGGAVVWSLPTKILEGSQPADYWEYFYDGFKPLTRYTATGIDPYRNAEMTVTLTKASGLISLGMLAVGDMRPVGIPQRDASVEPVDYSYIRTDNFGNSVVQKRNFATSMSINAKMPMEDAGSVLDTVQEILGTPCVVVGSRAGGFEWLTVFGLISGRISAQNYPYATLSLNVKGLI